MILDLSYSLRLRDGCTVSAVLNATKMMAPFRAIDQLGHSLQHIIHNFDEAEDEDEHLPPNLTSKMEFGGWMRWQESRKFLFHLPHSTTSGQTIYLVVTISLQMGFVESPPYFCAASKTAQDVVAMSHVCGNCSWHIGQTQISPIRKA